MKVSMRTHHYSDSDLPESPENSPDEDFGSKMEKLVLFRDISRSDLFSVLPVHLTFLVEQI